MWWFYTVILGMSFGQVLQELAIGVREWARSTPPSLRSCPPESTPPSLRSCPPESDRRPFLPAMLWQLFLLTLVVQVWLAVTYYRDTVEEVSIPELLAFLAVPAGILVMSFLLPEARWDSDLSRSATFGRVRPIFFGVLIAMVAVNLLHDFIIGEQGFDLDLLFQCLIISGAVVGLMVRSTVADTVLAVVMVLVVLSYIGLGYSTVEVGSEAAGRLVTADGTPGQLPETR